MKTPHLGCLEGGSAERQDRTVDTAIFSRVLYQLSYLGMRADFTIGREAVKKIPNLLMAETFFSQDLLPSATLLANAYLLNFLFFL